VLPGSRDAQIVARFGMPPGMPAWLQAIAREGSRIPAHGSAAAAARTVRSPPTVRHMLRASAMPSDRVAQAFPTARVLTVTTTEPSATFGLRSSIEDRRETPFNA